MSALRKPVWGDPILLCAVLSLALFGAGMVYSAGVVDVPSVVTHLWKMQLVWLGLGLAGLAFVLRVPVIWLHWTAVLVYGFALLLLVLALLIGTGAGTASSMSGWIAIGPIRVQPSEFAKLAVILMLARVLAQWQEPVDSLWLLWKPLLVVLVPMGLVMLQPDLGTGLVFTGVLFAMLFWAGTSLPVLFLLLSPALGLFLSFDTTIWGTWTIVLVVALYLLRRPISESVVVFLVNGAAGTIAQVLWDSLAPYQRNRFLVFLDPSVDPRGAGYNLIQSQVAIGSGGLFGKGWTEGTQKRLAFLPEQHTDFIFSVVGEELGFVGVCAVLAVFLLIFYRLIAVAERQHDRFARLVPFGLLGSWMTHVLINVGMVVGIMPITGIPLPFLSYGGSFLLANLLAVGIVLRVARESS